MCKCLGGSILFRFCQSWLIMLMVLLWLPLQSHALELASNSQLHGFVSLGYINSNSNPFYGDTEDGNFKFHEAAINGYWEPTDQLRLSGQLLYRKTGTIEQDNLNLDFLMLDFQFVQTDDHTMGIRLGRVKVPYGFYNSSRDVPHGRPAVFVPKSIYFESFRDAILSVDGAAVYGNLFNDYGTFEYQLFAGSSELDNNSLEHYLYHDSVIGDFEKVDSKGLQLMWTPEFNPNLKLAFSFYNVDVELEDGFEQTATELATPFVIQYLAANAANPFQPTADELTMAQAFAEQQLINQITPEFRNYISDAKLDADMYLLSFQYSWLDFTFTSEYLRIKSDYKTLFAKELFNKSNPESEGYYGQIEWQASEKLILLARYEEFYNTKSDRDCDVLIESGLTPNPYSCYSKGYTFGARWFINQDLSITGEYSRNRGVSWLPKDDDIDPSTLNEKWSYISLQLSYHF